MGAACSGSDLSKIRALKIDSGEYDDFIRYTNPDCMDLWNIALADLQTIAGIPFVELNVFFNQSQQVNSVWIEYW